MDLVAVEGAVLNDAAPFNGTLISRGLVDLIGYPNRDFFIKGDENDYRNRARKAGAYIATVLSSLYYHPQLKQKERSILGRNICVGVEVPWKEYYRARNYTYMYKSNGNYKAIAYELFFCKVYAILSDKQPQKFKNCRYVIKGIFHGLLGKLGKTVLPG